MLASDAVDEDPPRPRGCTGLPPSASGVIAGPTAEVRSLLFGDVVAWLIFIVIEVMLI
jgi:hypothetical protein